MVCYWLHLLPQLPVNIEVELTKLQNVLAGEWVEPAAGLWIWDRHVQS